MTGGGEYSETQPKIKYDALPHAGGSGGGVSIKPLGFLVVENVAYARKRKAEIYKH